MNKWNVVKVVEGVEQEDYGMFTAETIDELRNQLNEKFGVNFQYEEDKAFSSSTYTIYEPNNDYMWLVAYKD